MDRSNETTTVTRCGDMAVTSGAVNSHVYDYIKQMLAELSIMARDNGLTDSSRFIDAALLIIMDHDLEQGSHDANEMADSVLS